MARDIFDLTGKTALITGGSRGLGLQMAEALGDYGARLVISSRDPAKLAVAAEGLRGRGAVVETIVADNGKEADVIRLADEAVAVSGRVDILVNNAGIGIVAAVEDHSLADWDAVMDVNLRALFILSQRIAAKSMIPNRYGRIINIASGSGFRGSAGFISYNASKGAVVNFTRGLAAEWGKHGITANTIAPGVFPSDMTADMLATAGEEAFAAASPLNRVGDSEDLKGAVLLFASDAGKHITGQALLVDGGASAVI